MVETDRVARVVHPRKPLSDAQARQLEKITRRRDDSESEYRAFVVGLLDDCSFTEVSKATGISTSTLQQWKRRRIHKP